MQNQEILTQFGLSKVESSIYVTALELGESLPSHLAEKAGVKRPTLYKLMPGLFAKGLLSQTMKGKRRYIVAEEPQVLVEKKQAELKILEETLPELRLLLRTAKIKPSIIFYEGVEGIKKVYVDTLRERTLTLEFLGLTDINPAVAEYAKNFVIPTHINRRIPTKIIISGEPKTQRFKLKSAPYLYREIKTIPEKEFPIPLDMYVYGDNVAFILLRKDSEPMGIIIRSKEIATTMRSLFELIWQNL